MPKKKKDMITIGVDSSTTNCGVAIFKNGALVSTCNYKFSGTYDLDKLEKIIQTFDELFREHKPRMVILERPAPVRNSSTLTALNQVAGAIWATATLHGAFIDHMHNKIIKKIMEVNSKDDAIAKVKKDYGVEVETDHEADAVLTVEAYRIHMSEKSSG
jgi:Holliday junction resolvasome RuvABC endonuclease subunit